MEEMCRGVCLGFVVDAPSGLEKTFFVLGQQTYIRYKPYQPPVLFCPYRRMGGFHIQHMLCDSSVGLECFFSPCDDGVIAAHTPMESVSNFS